MHASTNDVTAMSVVKLGISLFLSFESIHHECCICLLKIEFIRFTGLHRDCRLGKTCKLDF